MWQANTFPFAWLSVELKAGGGESRSQQSKKQLKVSSSVLWLFQTWVGLVKKCKRR